MNASPAAYAPSWVDRLFDRIEALPGPTWITYALAGLLVDVMVNAAAWADGYVPVGTFDPLVNSLAVYVVVDFAAIHYLDAAAGRAWPTFRTAVEVADLEAERIAYELTTMPAGPALGASIAGALGAIVYFIGQYGAPFDLARPLILVAAAAISTVSFAGAGVFVYHTIRQLRLISRLHGYVTSVDLLDLEPLHGFAGVTAATGVILLGIVYLSAATDPATFSNPALLTFLVAVVALSVACFVVPLYGIHVRIVAEKSLRLAAAGRRLDLALRDLHQRADQNDLREADAVNKHLSSLLAERDMLRRIATWPWAPETVRGFATALVLPVVLWLSVRVLERVIG